jgi:hypothetical protein
MLSKIITWCTLAAFVTTLSSCYTDETVSSEQFKETGETIASVITNEGELLSFVLTGRYRAVVRDSTVTGRLVDGTEVALPLSRIRHLVVQRFDATKTILTVVLVSAGTVLAIALIAAAVKESCPFIYSRDGDRYVFDGEPYGGAICEALKRTDFTRLEHLKPVDGTYQLRLTNEVPESQYTDELTLWVADHDPAVRIVLDDSGRAHTIGAPLPPVSVTDEHGADQLKWVTATDFLAWETDLRTIDPDSTAGLRDTLRVAFVRQAGSTQAKLVTHLGTTLWGSQMLRRMTELRGDQYRAWYEQLRSPMALAMLQAWSLREELYVLKVRVQTARGWECRGLIPGGGPFMTEERATVLDLTGVEGDTVRLLLTPAAGFWQIDRLAIDYTPDTDVAITPVHASMARGDDGSDLRAALLETDGIYHTLPEPGRWATLEFPVPEPAPGRERTVFAKASGYYEMFLDANGPPRAEILRRLGEEPGFPVIFAVQEFNSWRTSMAQRPAPEGQ